MNLNSTTLTHSINKFCGAGAGALFIAMLMVYTTPSFSQVFANAPSAISASPSTICQGNSTTLRATSVGNTIQWYTSANYSVSIGSSASGGAFSVAPSSATTYYAQSVDPSGDTSATRAAVTVTVNTIPTITSTPADVNQNNDPGQCGAVVNYPAITATGTPPPTLIYSNQSGTQFQTGTTTVLVSAVNSCGNSSLSFDVTVNDNQPPTVIAPPDTTIVVPAGASSLTNPNLGTPNATDNCGILSVTNDAPATFYGGTTVVTWTATDNNGNTAIATQMVIIQLNDTPPVIGTITSNNADNTIAQNSSATLTINWTDANNLAPYTININWMDSSANTIISGITASSTSVSHTYSKSGVFSPVIIVTDGDNLSDTSVFQYIVVYTSGNYSTTASGCFNAPAGSLVSNPNLTVAQSNVSFGDECKPGSGCSSTYSGNNCPALAHSCYADFNESSHPGRATTHWFTLHTKLTNNQLTCNGDSIVFSGGSLAFNNIFASFGTAACIPAGKIIADNTVSAPTCSFNGSEWITRVPLAYSSSDIFITGAAITSNNGFTCGSSKSTALTGNFYSNKSLSSSWFYGEACYQPTFTNSTVGSVSCVCANGRQAGTPNNQTGNLVSGGSGGGGSNYTGSYSSTDNYTTCTCKSSASDNSSFVGDFEMNMGYAHFVFNNQKASWDYLAVSDCYIAQFTGMGYLYPNGCQNPDGYHYGILVVQTDKFNGGANGNKIRVKIWNEDLGTLVFDTQTGDPDDAMPVTPFNGCIKVNVPQNCVARIEAADVPAGTFQAAAYPNPCQSSFNFNVTTSSTDNVTIDIYDVLGKQVKSMTDVLPNTPLVLQNNLPNGMYFLHVKQGSNTQIIPMVKSEK